jgi:hypothetical protein
MNKVKLLLALVALIGSASLLSANDEPRKEAPKDEKKGGAKVTELMQKKLKHSQKVLEGVAVGDLEEIANNAAELIALSKQAEWSVSQSPQYELRSNEFRRSAEELVKYAKAKNLDAAAMSYIELTMTCVKCHEYGRDTQWAHED